MLKYSFLLPLPVTVFFGGPLIVLFLAFGQA